MSLKKFTTRPSARLIFLGIVCETDRRILKVPETKLRKLETLLKEAIQRCFITFYGSETLVGKMHQHECCRIPGHPLHIPHVQEDQPIPKSEILFN